LFDYIYKYKTIPMKNLFLIFTMVPMLAIGQVSNWRTPPPTQQQSTPQRSTPSVPQTNDVSRWRSEPSRGYDRPIRTRPGSNIIVRDPWLMNNWGWGWNRWDMWGAPSFGWNFWNPGFYFNDWGYRQPARVYYYDNGRVDTIRGKKPVVSFGIQKTNDRQIGGFFTIGNKGYFITEYNSSFERDNSTFFPNGNITQVDFPMVNDLVRRNSFYIGAGKRIKRTGIHLMIGTVSENVKWRGRDDIGFITFPKYSDRFTTLKIGALHDYKNFTIKFDYDPVITNATFGLGVNF
jgi:hypothetical protein